jgi:hypothetical protein
VENAEILDIVAAERSLVLHRDHNLCLKANRAQLERE